MTMTLIKRELNTHIGGIEEFWHDSETGQVVIKKVADIEKTMDMVKEMHNQHTGRPNYSDSQGQHLVARIPLVVVDLWKEQGFDWFQSTDKERRAWLDRPENAVFKTRPGKLNGVTNRNALTTKRS